MGAHRNDQPAARAKAGGDKHHTHSENHSCDPAHTPPVFTNMILLFPNLETLQLALTSSIVPLEITLAPAAVTFDDHGKIFLEPTASLTKTVTKNLDRIGVKGSKRHAHDQPSEVSCWPQILPLLRESATPTISNQAPILFELSNPDDLATLVSEMLRLGNDRQSFRWLAYPGESDTRRVLLRVIGPPYYTLLRALDPSSSSTQGAVRAYRERAPRVWVELGYDHPLATQLRAPEKQLLLVHHPRDWIYLEESAFQDVYDILQFKLPHSPITWSESRAPKRMTVPLRLTNGNAADTPEMWVLRDQAIQQLDTLVRDSDERLTQRLMFAVASDPKGNRSVILRTRPSKLSPPVLPLENAVAFKSFWKLPNLFLPVGKRLHPTLRRDAVRKLLADDPEQVVWLYPEGDGKFTPECVPDGAFRSLEDWVEYVIESEQEPLAAWIEATRFDFESFVCKDSGGPKTKPDRGDSPLGNRNDVESIRTASPSKPPGKGSSKSKSAAAKGSDSTDYLPTPELVRPPSEWKLRRESLEKQFLEFQGPLDAPERQTLWPELAESNAGEGLKSESAICWLNAMWDSEQPPHEWLAGWFRTEHPGTKSTPKAEDLDRQLANTLPTLEDTRATVASFLVLSGLPTIPAWLTSRLPAVQAYLEKHEGVLPVRAVWLAAYRLSQLNGADVLGLARVRDRLLQRLLEQGLQAERDLPSFLRFAGIKDSERLRLVRDRALDLHATIRKWTAGVPVNLPYVDLMFAFALAKLGETSQARKLVEDARKVMEIPVPATGQDQKQFEAVVASVTSNFLFKAFHYRIEQVLSGKSQGGQLSAELIANLEEITNKGRTGPANNPFLRADYVIARMREQSRLLEPQDRLDPYSYWTRGQDALKKELADLHSIREPAKLADRIRKLQRDGVQGKSSREVQFLVLHEALPLSSRVGEQFTVELIQQVPAVLAINPNPGTTEPPEQPHKQGELLDRALFMAGHFDRTDLVKQLVDEFAELIHNKPEEARYKLINVVSGQCLRSLKKLGMRDEIDRFMTRLRDEVLRGASIAEFRKKYANKPDQWGAVLQTLLNLAAGWLTFGWYEQAAPILDEARNELLNPNAIKLSAKDYPELARTYVTAVAQGPSESGLARISELFRLMDDKKIANTWTTSLYYSRFHLNLVEDVIRAIVSDEFALGATGRRWLDDDEYLVRRRIHADMRRHLERSGL